MRKGREAGCTRGEAGETESETGGAQEASAHGDRKKLNRTVYQRIL